MRDSAVLMAPHHILPFAHSMLFLVLGNKNKLREMCFFVRLLRKGQPTEMNGLLNVTREAIVPASYKRQMYPYSDAH